MPPRRRAVGPKTSAQPTLSFNNRAGKVTKPASTHTSKANENAAAKAEKLLEPVEIDEPTTTSEAIDAQIEEVPTTSELAIRAQTEQQKQEPTSQAEVKAAKITDVQIKTYWKVKEDERRAPRVHQQDVTLHDKILREFDLSTQFGPCIGIARMKRWKRAEKLKLNPPLEVLAVLLKEDAKNNPKVQRAYIDELMTSKYVID